MSNETLKPEFISSLSIENQRFIQDLPEIAKPLIRDDLEINQNFANNLDSYLEHEPKWHQFGILTHTKNFVEALAGQIPDYLREWQLDSKVDAHLNQTIGDKTKKELLMTAAIFHDIGKFARDEKEESGKKKPEYDGHEANSKEIIENRLKTKLLESGYSEEQIKYIADCAGLHYQLGVLRKTARESPTDYSIAFAKSPACQEECRKISSQNPEYQWEIGLLFLADSLAKTDVNLEAQSDEEIAQKTPLAEQEIKKRGLNPALINAVKQVPVNVAVARTYFEGLQ